MQTYIYNLARQFDIVAQQFSDRVALAFLDGSIIKYKQLDAKANQFANYLLNIGVKKGNVVAIINDKSSDGYAIMLACLKIGAIYTNLDGDSPVQRLSRMLETCKPAKVFIPDSKIALIEQTGYPIAPINYNTFQFHRELELEPVLLSYNTTLITGNSPAYIMFTSGSTGFPKGVVISHDNVLNFIKWTQETYSSTPVDRFTNINPLHFDNSVFDFYASLFTGASLIPVSEANTKNPRKLVKALNGLKPTIWFSVPSMLVYGLTLRAFTTNDLPDLRIFTFGGEGFPKNQLRKLWNLFGERITFINVYGPTECTCICSSYKVSDEDMEKDDLLPLGPMAPNFNHVIVNEKGKQVEEGKTGELYIVGPNVGQGYFNNTELTQQAFRQNPLHTAYSEMAYKSGDLVRFEKNKSLLYFCGRLDNQIKRMGYRIELEEIENALGSLSYVEENGVIYKKNGNSGKIIAFVHARQDEEIILQDLKLKIPSYMLPDEIIFHVHLPKNQNGKIDRLQLKEIYLKKILKEINSTR